MRPRMRTTQFLHPLSASGALVLVLYLTCLPLAACSPSWHHHYSREESPHSHPLAPPRLPEKPPTAPAPGTQPPPRLRYKSPKSHGSGESVAEAQLSPGPKSWPSEKAALPRSETLKYEVPAPIANPRTVLPSSKGQYNVSSEVSVSLNTEELDLIKGALGEVLKEKAKDMKDEEVQELLQPKKEVKEEVKITKGEELAKVEDPKKRYKKRPRKHHITSVAWLHSRDDDHDHPDSSSEEDEDDWDDDDGDGHGRYHRSRHAHHPRWKRSIVQFEPIKNKHLEVKTVKNRDLLPQEPLSERVADNEEDGGGGQGDEESDDESSARRRKRRHAGWRREESGKRRKREVRVEGDPTLYEKIMEEFSPLSSRVANEDLYDLFVDYFETGIADRSQRRRPKRSISGVEYKDSELDMTRPMEITFPESERSKTPRQMRNHQLQSHRDQRPTMNMVPNPGQYSGPSSNFGPMTIPGSNLGSMYNQDPVSSLGSSPSSESRSGSLLNSDPSSVSGNYNPQQHIPGSKRLSRQDVRELTRQTDLSQIMGWLQKMATGREHEVTAALLVAKDKQQAARKRMGHAPRTYIQQQQQQQWLQPPHQYHQQEWRQQQTPRRQHWQHRKPQSGHKTAELSWKKDTTTTTTQAAIPTTTTTSVSTTTTESSTSSSPIETTTTMTTTNDTTTDSTTDTTSDTTTDTTTTMSEETTTDSSSSSHSKHRDNHKRSAAHSERVQREHEHEVGGKQGSQHQRENGSHFHPHHHPMRGSSRNNGTIDKKLGGDTEHESHAKRQPLGEDKSEREEAKTPVNMHPGDDLTRSSVHTRKKHKHNHKHKHRSKKHTSKRHHEDHREHHGGGGGAGGGDFGIKVEAKKKHGDDEKSSRSFQIA